MSELPKYVQATSRRVSSRQIDRIMQDPSVEPWVQNLILLLYFFGCRISEALALLSSDFEVVELEGVEFLYLSCPTLKNPHQDRRDLYVKLDRPYVKNLVQYIRKKDKSQDTRIWRYSRQWCRIKIQRRLPNVSPHVFRHSRLDGFAQAGESAFALQSWAGWSSVAPANSYVQSVSTRKMAQREK